MNHLAEIAERINTGLSSLDTSRALVVFNQTNAARSGAAVFSASMSWPRDTLLPPVIIMDSEGHIVPSALTDLSYGSDAKGRSDRSQLTFSLRFAVSDVPANGWATYIAAYADASSPLLENFQETTGLVVVETTRHEGDLPSVGIF